MGDIHDVSAQEQETISSLKQVDKLIDKQVATNEIVPVTATEKSVHPGVYVHKKQPPLSKKYEVAQLLVPKKGDIDIQVPVTDEDVETIKDKAYVATLFDFDRWVIEDYLKSLPLDDAAKREWLHQIYPEWFERQVEAMKIVNDANERFHKLEIDGPKTIQDLYFMYRYIKEMDLEGSTSQLTENTRSGTMTGLYTKLSDAEMDKYAKLSFQRGIFSFSKSIIKRFEQMDRDMLLRQMDRSTHKIVGPWDENQSKRWRASLKDKRDKFGIASQKGIGGYFY